LKAIAEFVENNIDARAENVIIVRGKERDELYLKVIDDGERIPLNDKRLEEPVACSMSGFFDSHPPVLPVHTIIGNSEITTGCFEAPLAFRVVHHDCVELSVMPEN